MKNIINIHLLSTCILVLLLLVSTYSYADEIKSENLSLSYIEDNGNLLDRDQAFTNLKNNKGKITKGTIFNKGSSESHYWLLLKISNNKSISKRRLATEAAYRLSLKAYLYRDEGNKPELILDENENKPFTSRNNGFRFLNSYPFILNPNEEAYILIDYKTRGATFLPLSLKSEKFFTKDTTSDHIFGAVSYTFGLTLGVFFLLLNVAMKNQVGLYYSGLFLLGLLLISALDGYAFKFLWPNWPRWNQYSTLVIIFVINAAGFYVSNRVANLGTKQTLFKKTSLLLMSINLLLILSVTTFSFSLLVSISIIFLFTMFVFHLIAMRSWVSLTRNKVTVFAMLLITLLIGILVALFFISDTLPSELINYSSYIAYLLISLAIMTGITAHVTGMRNDNETALEQQLVAAKREAKMNQSLFEAEQNYSKIREIAQLRQKKLATATHDIRQPLVSLRATMDSISQKQKPEIRQQLHDAFDYMEQLCNSYLQESRPENNEPQITSKSDLDSQLLDDSLEVEAYPVSLILNTAKRMFENEALSKGLEFHLVNSSFMTQTPPLVLMRIISNFLSNAIKHTQKGKVLIGCRHKGEKLRIEIHDTGSGIPKRDFNKIQNAYEKGENSEGEGLGLAISQQLAQQHDLKITINSIPDKGSCFALEI